MLYLKLFPWLSIGCFLFSTPLFASTLTLACPHKDIPFKIELAQTPQAQEKGLMFRTSLANDEGMLFLYPRPQPITMWMKNTPLSLDMIFGDETGKILAIHEKAAPFSLKTIGPVRGATQVLEVLGGTIQEQGITKNCILKFER